MAAALAPFNAALTRTGFAAVAIVVINLNQVNSFTSLIGIEKNDVKLLMKNIRGS
jgi:hypothetical protein